MRDTLLWYSKYFKILFFCHIDNWRQNLPKFFNSYLVLIHMFRSVILHYLLQYHVAARNSWNVAWHPLPPEIFQHETRPLSNIAHNYQWSFPNTPNHMVPWIICIMVWIHQGHTFLLHVILKFRSLPIPIQGLRISI